MTVIDADRTNLDAALAEDGTTLLLISDDPDPVAELVHDKAEEVAKDWQRVFLLKSLAVLKPKERQTWFDEEGHFAVVGGKDKVVAFRSPISALMLPSGKPSGVEIRWAFNQGDLLP
jgi:hypothetical protein